MGRLYPRNLTSVVSCVSASLLLVLLTSLTAVAIADDAAKPARKDSAEAIRPKHAVLSPSIEPSEAKPGDTVTFKVTAKLDPGFHIYKLLGSESDRARSARVLTFSIKGGLELVGGWTASRDPEKHKDPNFPEVEVVEYYEGEVTWSVKLKVPSGLSPGKKALRCQARYMVCDAKTCSLDGQMDASGSRAYRFAAGCGRSGGRCCDRQGRPRPANGRLRSRPAIRGVTAAAAQKADASRLERKSSRRRRALEQPSVSGDAPVSGRRAFRRSKRDCPEGSGRADSVLDRVGDRRALRAGHALRLADGADHGELLHQARARSSGRKKATGLAFMYCLSIIAVFTAVGVIFSFFFSASSLQTLANNPWLNMFVAGLFLVFGLSLLGLFELSLPSFLLNASSQNEGRGGLIGVFFMALTLTITSFTCTFPVVGGLLVMAAGGDFFYPIVGLATFATVLAFPFFLLALSPGLISKMPRSGDWMNAVKVVGGLGRDRGRPQVHQHGRAGVRRARRTPGSTPRSS